MTSMKVVQLSRPPIPLSIHVQNYTNPLTLGVQFQTNPPPLQMITNQFQGNIIQGCLSYVIRSFLQVGFRFSINSLILSGFPLTSFYLAEASLSAFPWHYTLVCKLSKNITKCLLFMIIHIFSTHFSINLFYKYNLKI